MLGINSPWKSVTDREKWVARGASFVAKAKATKVVWFPPKPVETGGKAASTAKKTTKKAAKKTAGSAKKATSGGAKGAKRVVSPVRKKS